MCLRHACHGAAVCWLLASKVATTAAVASVAFVTQTQLQSYEEKQPPTSSWIKGPEVQVGQASKIKKVDETCNVEELSPEDFKKELAAAVKF
jgi:hypothetical protein